MKLEHFASGMDARLRISGAGRFGGAALLTLWLLFWAAGEAFALFVLAAGAWALVTGQPLGADRSPLAPAGALPMGLFLLFWLAFWTMGGIAAGAEWLRLLFGWDRILARADGIDIEHGYGLFRSRRTVSRDDIRRFYQLPGGIALCVETAHGSIELTRLGTRHERSKLEQALAAQFQTHAHPSTDGALPAGWCEISSPEHEAILVRDPVARGKWALVVWFVGALIATVALYLLSTAQQQPALWGVALIVAAAVGWGAVQLSFGRDEWRLHRGRLILQRRFGQSRRVRFETVALELLEDNSGDSGPSYKLTVVAAGARSEKLPHRAGRHRRVIHSQSDDPTEPRNLGLWLSHRCQLPFADLTTPAAKAKGLKAHLKQLADSGRFGRVAVRHIQRFLPSRGAGS